MHYGKMYFKNQVETRKSKKIVEQTMITLKEVVNYGLSVSRIKKWEKEGKIYSIEEYGSNRRLYNLKKLIELDTGQMTK